MDEEDCFLQGSITASPWYAGLSSTWLLRFEVGRERSIQAVEQALLGDRRIVLAAQHQAAVEEPTPDDIYTIGTLCEIKQILKMPEGQLRILVEGLERVVVHP
jgi:ATP-dependent Lon protease